MSSRPIPTRIKLLRGNPGHRPLSSKDEPQLAAELPPCPRYLRGVARRLWDDVGKQLLRMRVITAADATALELLCGAYAEYFKASAVVRRRGATYKARTGTGFIERRRPEVAIAADAWKRVRSMLLEFGISPASR